MNALRRPSAILPVLAALAILPAIGCSGDKPVTPPATATATAAGPAASPVASKTPMARAGGPNTIPELKSPLIEPVGVKVDDFHPGVNDTLKASVVTTDADGDGVTVTWQWSVNRAPLIGEISDTLKPGKFKKNDEVQAEARARDTRGAETVVPVSYKVKIKNSAPVITSNPTKLNGYKIVATDPDNDPITYSLEAPLPGFTLTPDGTLTFDVTKGKEANGKTLVILAKDNDYALAKQSIQVKF